MTVFANGLEISSKAQGCKLIAAMPDVCMTPPQTPATPPGVPIPYPNFGMDSDLTDGSSKVLIGGKPISMENKSKYSKVTGDEAGCAPKKGIITSNNTGPMYAQAWSMNVKVQGKGVVRFGDIATSNHGSNPGQPAPMPLIGQPTAPAAPPAPPDCGAGNHVEQLQYPTPPDDEVDTKARLDSAEKSSAGKPDDLFEVTAARYNFAQGHMSAKAGHQISNGPTNGPQKIFAVCTICGAKREIDHVTDDGVPCEVKNKKSGFPKDQKMNNEKFMKDNPPADPSKKLKYKVPSNVNSAAAKDLQSQGFEVVRIPGVTK